MTHETAATVKREYVASWRSPVWFDDVPSRPGWLLTCNICGPLGFDREGNRWAYANGGSAASTATRHERRHANGRI